ncbi:MAG: Hsp20/alpha crystallin family protein [Spirochaetaceae bacterium]|nr:MAG: Hsp20/alpha crystallin family protein [Spirochaetaceae bacterium]
MKEQWFDMGHIFDEIFETAQSFKHAFKDGCKRGMDAAGMDSTGFGEAMRGFRWDENVDFYPLFNYPPANVFLTPERTLTFEFALAGFEEKDICLEFQGDYMVLSAKPGEARNETGLKFFKRRLKFKEILNQKYFAPENKFDRTKVKAVFKNGILKVEVPPKEDFAGPEGVKIDIVREGD